MMSTHTSETDRRTSHRRTLLHRLGVGAVGFPFVASRAVANPTQGSIDVTNVEVGHINFNGEWESKETVENNTAKGFFDVRVEVYGLDPPTSIVYVVSPVRQSDMQVMATQSNKRDVSERTLTIQHGDPLTHAFRTGIPGSEWDGGPYAVDVAVIDVKRPAFDAERKTFRIT